MLTKEQQEKLVALIRKEAGAAVAEIVEERWASAEAEMRGQSAGITDVLTQIRGALPTRQEEKGLTMARAAWCIARAYKAGGVPAEHAEQFYGKDSEVVAALTQRALTSDDFAAGGALVGETVSDEIIELLRAKAIVRSLGARELPNPTGTLRVRKMTGGSTSNYIGEGENIPTSQPTTGMVTATAKKLATLVPVSNDLLRRADPRTERTIRDDMVQGMVTKEDITFIRGSGSDATPKGLRLWSSNLTPATGHDPGAVTLDNVTSDLGGMIQILMDANAPMERVGWMLEPRTWKYLITVRDGNGNLVFKPEMDNGTLFGFPFRLTTQIPRNLDASGSAGNDETELYLVDFSQVIIADTMNIELTAHEAAYHDSGLGAIKSAVSADETVIRAISEHDLIVRHEEAIVVLENVVWGA